MNALPFRIEYRVQFDAHDDAPNEHWRDVPAEDDSLNDAKWRMSRAVDKDTKSAFRIVERVIFEKVIVS
jgi:hypothetical protein